MAGVVGSWSDGWASSEPLDTLVCGVTGLWNPEEGVTGIVGMIGPRARGATQQTSHTNKKFELFLWIMIWSPNSKKNTPLGRCFVHS